MPKQTEPRQEANLDELAEEHARVRDMLQHIHSTLALRQSRPQNVAGLLDELKEHVQGHFSHEEEGGYFADVVARAPRYTANVDALLQQHALFLRILDRLRQNSRNSRNSTEWWTDMTDQFDDFVCQFLEHERGEIRLVQEAYCRDIGSGE